MAIYQRRNHQCGFAIPSNLDKFSAPSRATAKDNTALNKASLNFDLPVLDPSAPGLSAPIDFQFFIKTFIEMAKNQAPPLVSIAAKKKTSNRPLKARNSNLYYGNLYIECYYFCQQCKDYFEIAGGKNYRRVLFIVFFLNEKICYH